MCAIPDGHRTELLLPGIQIIDIDDEPVMCPVNANANSQSAGACRRRRAGSRRRRTSPASTIKKPPVEGSPMTAERYLSEKKPDAVAR